MNSWRQHADKEQDVATVCARSCQLSTTPRKRLADWSQIESRRAITISWLDGS
jgi:hypothetical protein